MTAIKFFVLMSFCATFGNCAVTDNNQEADQIKLFNDENDINELIGFPDGFYEKHGKQSPFIVLSKSPSDQNLNIDVSQVKKILDNEEKMEDTFFSFKKEFNKSYEETQEPKRKSILKKKIEYTLNHNMEARKGKQEYTLGINQFSDLTFEEFSKQMLRKFEEVNVTKAKTDFKKSEPTMKAPSHINWTKFDTPVKYQGDCSSCWAYAAVAVIENHLKKNNYTKEVDLSEQELVDCCDQCHANIDDRCSGGYLYSPFEYARDRFISHENFYEYKGGQCQRQLQWDDKIANIIMTNFTCAKLGEDAMRDTIAGVGAVATAVFVNSDFMSYKKGVYNNTRCEGSVDHAVVISGYRYDMSSGENYWIIKNSWGASWGENGYMRIAMGNNRCGIGKYYSCYPHIIPRKDPKNDYEKSLNELKSEFLYRLSTFKFEMNEKKFEKLKKMEDNLTETKENNVDFNKKVDDSYSSYSLCGNWEIFKEEKCIKIFDAEKLVTFEEAIKSCTQMDNNSQLLTIHSKEEQDFVSQYVFKTNKLLENVWLGFRNKTGQFEWNDKSNKQYTNWRSGYPINITDANCVQMEQENSQWNNLLCLKKGLVVCQKLPETTLSDLLKQVLDINERLKKSEEINTDLDGRLKKSEEKNVDLEGKLKKTMDEKNEVFNVVFNKDLAYNHLFTDRDGKKKAFLIPMSAMRKRYTFDDSVNLCKTFNSTLIEIESLEKQIILESFLGRLGFESNQSQYFWINAERNSSGKWKWLKSDKEFTFTNWHTSNPITNSDYNKIYVRTYSTETFGKWGNYPKTNTWHVICEHTFEF